MQYSLTPLQCQIASSVGIQTFVELERELVHVLEVVLRAYQLHDGRGSGRGGGLLLLRARVCAVRSRVDAGTRTRRQRQHTTAQRIS